MTSCKRNLTLMKVYIILAGLFSFLILTACGLNTERPIWEYNGYYQTNWTTSDNIITSKRYGIASPQEVDDTDYDHKAYHDITILNLINNEEIVITSDYKLNENPDIILNITGSDKNWIYITMAPALFEEGSNIDGLHIVSITNNRSIKLNIKDANNEQNEESYKRNIFFSPQGDRFLITYSNQYFYIFDTGGNLIRHETKGGYAVWKNESELYFYNRETDKLSLYQIQTESVQDLSISFKPEYYNPSQNSLYKATNGVFYTLDLSTNSITTKNLTYNNSNLQRHFFSSDGLKLLLTKKGYFESYTKATSLGIYTYDLQTDQLTKIRD